MADNQFYPSKPTLQTFIKMKNKNIFIGLCLATVAAGFALVSCNDLDLEPLDKSTAVSYYKTTADFDGAIFAAYSSMQDMWVVNGETGRGGGDGWGAFWAISLATSDDVTTNSLASSNGANILLDATNLDEGNYNTNNKFTYTLYSQIYEGIARANIVIENVANGENELTAQEQQQYIGEAKFIRGFFHFLAAQIWGTPPLVTEVPKTIEGLTYSNSTKDDLYAAIIRDFKDASDALPTSWDAANIGRATKWAAKAFEGKAYVWNEQWNDAVSAFEQVESNGGYALLADYQDVFAWANENSTESVFEIQYGGPFSDDNGWVYDDNHSENFKASQGIARTWFMYTNRAFGDNNSLAWYVPTTELLDLYQQEPDDKRIGYNFYLPGDEFVGFSDSGPFPPEPYNPDFSETGISIKKYFGPENEDASQYRNNVTFNNERFLRYSEVLLLHAEALLQGGSGGTKTPEELVNATRVRAGLTPIASVTLTDLMEEKRKELAFETTRFFDMIRWGLNGAKFLPFPQAEIDRNQGNLVQNP